ncbi:MAG TPA: ABC transporter permease [Hanamia sp.]|nr:ABC transporter permease [Hanamia sp.]
MFKNYFKTAWRNLIKGRSFSFINVAGLGVGIACASLIFLWVEYNLNFNSSIPDVNNIYQIENDQAYGKDMYTFAATSVLVRDALMNEFPGVVDVSRYDGAGATVSLDNKHLAQSGAYVDSSFLKMFGLPLIEGNEIDALNDISKIAVSQKLAKNYFGDADVIGKTLLVDNHPYKVSAVYKDIPQNVQFYGVDFLLPFQIFYNQNKGQGIDAWGNNWTNTWVKLNPNTNVTAFNEKLRKLIHQKDAQTTNESLWLYPLKRLNLYGVITNGKEDVSRGKIQYIKMFSMVALIILIIACINFMNLSTARSQQRAKEIGMRKVLGSTRQSLIAALLSESLIVAYLAVLFAVVVVAVVLPLFSNLIGIHLSLNLFYPSHLLFLIIIGALCGLVAGSYPALYLSSFRPVLALKNQITKNAGNAGFIRKGLVVLQFAISVIIIIAVAVVYHQIQFTKNRDLGFNKDMVMYVPATPTLTKSFASLKQDILNTNDISSVSLGGFSPLAMYNNGGGWNWEGKSTDQDILVTNVSTDADYLKTFGIKLAAGRVFSQDPNVDSMNIIINESFAKLMGKAGHIGGQIWRDQTRLTIIGITKNFVYNNMNEAHPAPLIFFNSPSNTNYIFMAVKPDNDLQKTITKLQGIVQKADPTQSFDYHFVDKDFEQKFHYQQFIGSLATIFGCLAIFISCLGLFGLASFVAEQRKKEIGVRKVLGASVHGITALLSKDFLKLVFISCLIAFPVAWWMMNNWLQNYDYRTDLSLWIFAAAGVGALLITLLTVSFQAIKAAVANPVKSLRSE